MLISPYEVFGLFDQFFASKVLDLTATTAQGLLSTTSQIELTCCPMTFHADIYIGAPGGSRTRYQKF